MEILLLDRTDQKITGTRSRVELDLIQIYFYLANLVDLPVHVHVLICRCIHVHENVDTIHSILFYSILLDYQSLYGHEKEDESGLSSCDLLGGDAGTVPPDDLLH